MTTEQIVSDEQMQREEEEAGRRIFHKIEREFEENHAVIDRMEKDYDLYTLKEWQPDIEDSLSPEDA